MSAQRPYETPPRPPESAFYPRMVQFQVTRVPQGMACYPGAIPRFIGPPIPEMLPYYYMNLFPPVQVPPSLPPSYSVPGPDINLPGAISEPSIGSIPASNPMLLPPPVSSALESSESLKKGSKHGHKTAGGIYKCNQCERTYLSYPALYTHIKLKHPTLSHMSPLEEERRRGRPKKPMFKDEKELICGAWFEEPERKGGPTDVLAGFPQAYQEIYGLNGKYGGYSKHPLYLELSKPQQQAQFSAIGGSMPKIEPRESDEMAEIKQKRLLKCDRAFAEYLRYVAQRVRKEYYVQVIKFVLMYRECVNQFAGKLNEQKKKLPDMLALPTAAGAAGTEKEESKEEYCLENNAELLPDVCNEFVTVYVPEKHPGFDLEEAKGLTLNLCNWLFHNRYTCSALSLLGEKSC